MLTSYTLFFFFVSYSKMCQCQIKMQNQTRYILLQRRLFVVVLQQAVPYYTGNTCSIARMHYLLTYIAYTCSQEHTTDIQYALCRAWSSLMNDILPKAYLEIGSEILGDKGTVTLAENCDFLLNVFYVILCFFQINNLNGHNFLSPIVDAFKNFTERAFPYPLQLGEKLLRISSEILCDRQMDGERENSLYFKSRGATRKLSNQFWCAKKDEK